MKKLVIAASFLTSALMGQVLGVGKFTHVVGSLDRAIEFYGDALGLEMTGVPGQRAFSANPVISSLFNAPGVQSRMASFKIPESDLVAEIVEFQGLNSPPVRSRFYDPGAVTLSWAVADLEAVKARLNRLKDLEWISAYSASVTVREPEGIFVTLRQIPKPPRRQRPEDREAWVGVTVEDLDKATRLYWEVLGFTGDSLRRLRAPGDGFPLHFDAPNYADRKPVQLSVHDPGAGILQLKVGDLDAAMQALKEAGAAVASLGSELVTVDGNRAVILRDLNNFFLQVLEQAK
jgi:catechol 2,3-dioxygenase-like lactoylglutathione lyase family enzyme